MATEGAKAAPAVGVAVRELLEDRALGLTVYLVAGRVGVERRITHPRIQKSGLVFVGHTHGLVPERVQILGETEMSYVEALSEAEQRAAAEHLFGRKPALVLVTRGAAVPGPFQEAADRFETPVVVCAEETSVAIAELHALLDERLAPRTRIHGVLVDVFEIGVLLLGRSGIGKSECALDLVQRGHRLVADDVIECDYRPPGMIFGEPAPLLRNHIEVRGLGILDIKELFGVTAIRERKRIDLVARFEDERAEPPIDRLGLEDSTREILGVAIREVMLVLRPGRSASSLIEMAARNELLRVSGKNSSRAFVDHVDRTMVKKSSESGSMHAVLPSRSLPGGRRSDLESQTPPPRKGVP
jgi:HPr kinase/phosphorylase